MTGLQPGDMIVSALGDSEGESNSDFIFSRKRPPGQVIKLLTNKLMFPFRLVCIRSKDGKTLPSLVNDPSPEDYLAASQRKVDVPDYMKTVRVVVWLLIFLLLVFFFFFFTERVFLIF